MHTPDWPSGEGLEATLGSRQWYHLEAHTSW